MPDEKPKANLEAETIVVQTEQGVVFTGSRIEVFEARVIHSIRKPFRIIYGLIAVLFVMMAGGAIFLSSLSTTVHNTDKTLSRATGPAAQQQNQLVIKALVSDFDCANQRNLQKAFAALIASGQMKPIGVFVDARCETPPDQATTTTTTTVKSSPKKDVSAMAPVTRPVSTTTTTLSARSYSSASSTTTTTTRAPPESTTTTTQRPTTTTSTPSCINLILGELCRTPKGNQNGS